MVDKKRLLGIDLCRGIATYAVILVHSGDEYWGIPIDSQAIAFRLLFYFAVPFFLAASFYFMTARPDAGTSAKFWRSRIDRILIPYALWSVAYLSFRVIVFSLTKKQERLQELLQDPLSLIFFGGASYHLYFLPLLIAGTLLMLIAPYLSKQWIKLVWLILATALSIALYEWVLLSGNAFQLGPNVAFVGLFQSLQLDISQHPLMRLVAVEVSWILRCLPHFLMAIVLNRVLPKIASKDLHSMTALIVFFATFFIGNAFGGRFLPGALQEVLVSYSLLLFGISLSSRIKLFNLIKSLGVCSFGIYLIHPFAMNFTKTFIGEIAHYLTKSVSIWSMLVISITSFFLSWIAVDYLRKNKQLAKYFLGA